MINRGRFKGRGSSRVLRNAAAILIFLLLTACYSPSCTDWGNSPRTEYYIEGSQIEIAQPSSVDPAVSNLASGMMGGVELFMDLWRVDADDSDENYKIESAYVKNTPRFPYYNSAYVGNVSYRISGALEYPPGMLNMDLNKITGTSDDFTNLRLEGNANYDDAQRLIKQVRLPVWSSNTSSDTALITWEFTGSYQGSPFSLSFTQVFYGKSRYPVYPSSP